MRRLLDWALGVNLPPWGRGLPAIEVIYVSCDRCGALAGGIAGKGPWRSFSSGQRCRHAWRGFSLDEFRDEASKRYGIDWSMESSWWQRPA